MAQADPKVRVLIVDDSAIVRKMLADTLSAEPDMEVVGVAGDPFIARDLILRHRPDVLTLDIEMPRMDGLTFLHRLMEHRPMPVIVVSSVTPTGSAASIEALAAGAIDVIVKPGGPYSVAQVTDRLKRRIRELRSRRPMRYMAPLAAGHPGLPAAKLDALSRANGLIVVGASTGGTQAIEALLSRLPADAPPIMIVQHMPAQFTRAFANRLNGICPMTVVEANGSEPLRRGTAYIAPGDFHMVVEARGVELRAIIGTGPAVHYQRPSVDVLFHSAARLRGVPTVALLLTGMGTDGADGMAALKNAGAITIAEAEQSCVVFGMPAEAIARGAASHVATLLAMPRLIADSLASLQATRDRSNPSDPAEASTSDTGNSAESGAAPRRAPRFLPRRRGPGGYAATRYP
jgi:two-component system chemotaxis response regulator CheB